MHYCVGGLLNWFASDLGLDIRYHLQKSSQKTGMYYYDYNKAARPGRKLGHVTITADTMTVRDRIFSQYQNIISLS